MGMLENHKMVKRKAKGKDHNRPKISFFSDLKCQEGDRQATGKRRGRNR